MTSRRMKIIGVICGIICVGTASTLCLKAYMDASLASGGGYEMAKRNEIPVEIVVNQTEKSSGTVLRQENAVSTEKEDVQGEEESDGPLWNTENAMAGVAKIMGERNREKTEIDGLNAGDKSAVSMTADEQTVALTTADAEEEFLNGLLADREVYMEYLGDIELQVKKIYGGMEGVSLKEMQEAQDYAYRIWDDELNRIYPALKRSLSEEEGEALKQAELQWIKDRDAKAQRDSASAGSESGRLLHYNRSLTDTTRERTYILVEWYFEENGE